MIKRGQKVKLKSKSGKRIGALPSVLEVTVIQSDSVAGYFAEVPTSKEWRWFDPSIWEEVK